MCYHKAQTKNFEELASHYAATFQKDDLEEPYQPRYHENGFDFLPTPVLTAAKPDELRMYNWGFIPFWVKDLQSGLRLRIQTLNCISEEMFDKASFKDAAKAGQRCLIPCTGFYEWRWMDEKGKTKIPYHIKLKEHELFSLAGLFSKWKDRSTEQSYYTYTVLTTKANGLMSQIHNSKMRMPVIISRQYEKDWLNQHLTKDDVLAFCQPIDDAMMHAHPISKLITTKGADTNVPDVMKVTEYEQLNSK
ncbi:MAG TPA: SOS response-associated peptidase [Chryseosolibacter sp.]|nr:SOS response-associated peptidase [Chryseosolibacter sp.]